MKTHSIRTALIAVLTSTAADLHSAGSYTLETAIFVFRNSEVRESGISAHAATGGGSSAVYRSPAVIRFGEVSLSLDGTRLSWSGGGTPPDRFTRIETPRASLLPDRPVALLFTSPVQYLEKSADGSLKVREIAGDSPDAPHWRLSFKLEPEADDDGHLSIDCEVDVASVSARESLPGVTLPVGKPVLARFNETLPLKLSLEEWSALVVSPPDKSDYTMLTLLKVVPGGESDNAARSDRLMTAEEFARFATYYYRHPQPEQISRAIESLGTSGFLSGEVRSRPFQYQQRAYTCVGFFAEVFAATPERVREWPKLIDQLGKDGDTRSWLQKALKLSRPGAILAFGDDDSSALSRLDEIYVFFGAFFASGNPAYLRKVVDRLEYVDDVNQSLFDAGGVAMVLLAYNVPEHPLMRKTLEAARKEVSPRTRELIDDLLSKDVAAVLQEVRDMDPDPRISDTGNSRNSLPWRRPLPSTPPSTSFP